MAPTLLFAAMLGHIMPSKGLSNRHDSEDDHGDPERGPSGPGTSQDQTFDGDNNDGDDGDQDIEDLYDYEEKHELDAAVAEEESERRPGKGQGVPLTPSGTMSSSSMHTFSRPLLPRWLVKIKEVLFASHADDHDDFVPNYRRLPIISGSLIPFSILLEIPGLTEHWYVRTEGNQVVESRPNPPLVIVAMSFSMALALLANAALVYRFLERRVKASTIVCIISLTLHDILNIVTVTTFAVQHRFADGFTNGEAFWMTICSTVISTITNVTLIWDLVKTPNFSKAGSGITRKQRSLVIITIIFLTYIAIGALISSFSMSLTFVNGLFFTIVTTLTIGFGDIVPVTPAQRVIVCLYAVLGIIILGAAVRLTSEAVLEGLQVGYRRRIREFRNRRRERKHKRQQVRRWRVAVEERLVERGIDVWTADKPSTSTSSPSSTSTYTNTNMNVRPATLRRGSTFVPQALYLNTEALPPDVLEEAALEAGVAPEQFIGRKFGRRARQNTPLHHHHHLQQQQQQQQRDQEQEQQQQQSKESARPARVPLEYSWTLDDGAPHEGKSRIWSRACEWWDGTCEALRLKRVGSRISGEEDPTDGMSYQEMIKVLEKEERRSLYTKLGLAWALFFMFWTIGSLIFSMTENWTYGATMYFCFIAFTTIGYGDLAPETAIGRGIFVFWALFGVGAMTILIAVVTDAFSSKYRSVTHDKSFDRAVRRYRQGQVGGTRKSDKARKRRSSVVVPALQANLARVSSREPGQSYCAPKRAQTLDEAESRLRARIEPLPEMILKEVLRLRDHTRYFVMANGHADAMSVQVGGAATPPPVSQDFAVPDGLKELLDEVAHEEGFEERLKQEVWDDAHARNTLVLLSLEKGARKMVEAAELALETLSERDELRVMEERAVVFEEPEEIGKDAE